MPKVNEFGQPIGDALPDWKPCDLPQPVILTGRSCRLEPLNLNKHADDLFAAYCLVDARLWTYTFDEPFTNVNDFRRSIAIAVNSEDINFAVIDLKVGKAVGQLTLKGADPANGVIECGGALFSPLLKQSILSTEACYLVMAYAFDQLGYRRYESKCDSNNKEAQRSLLRSGYTREGVLRNYCIFKGISSDSICFSIIDDEWPQIKAASLAWLAPENFDKQGRQIQKLEDIRNSIKRKIQHVPCSL